MKSKMESLVRDRRQDERYIVRLPVNVYCKTEIGLHELYKATTLTVSQEGICFKLPISLPHRTRHGIEMQLSNTDKLQGQIHVLWVKVIDKGFLYGASLDFFSAEQMNLWADFFGNFKSAPPTKSDRRDCERRSQFPS